MRMPGFNAEGSLGRASTRYRAAGMHAAWASSQGVTPQLPQQVQNCYAWCSLNGEDPLSCFYKCGSGYGDGGGSQGGGGGTGGGGIPSEHCGKCITTGPHKGKQLCVIPGKGSYYADC